MDLDYDIVALDDDELDLEIMSRLLRNTPYRIKCFVEPSEALAFLDSHQPRFLLVDYRMCTTDGIAFIRQLSGAINLDAIKVCVSSGGCLPEHIAKQARELGAYVLLKDEVCSKGYLEKLCAGEIDSLVSRFEA